MKPNSFRRVKLFALVASALFAIWACNLGGEDKTEEVFTFPALADSLKGSDRAVIFLTTTSGVVIDTLFDGPMTSATRFENLVAPKFDGGKAIVVIEGYKDGNVLYKIEKTYDGPSGKVDKSITVIIRPAAEVDSVVIRPDTLKVIAKGLQAALAATVYPDTLFQTVTWKSLDDAIATVSTSGMVSGQQAGSARVVATSPMNGKNSDTAVVIVAEGGGDSTKVRSVNFTRTRIEIYLGGTAELPVVQVLPIGANPGVTFRIADPTVVEIVDGKVKGLKEGPTMVTARSVEDSTLTTSLEVFVLPKLADPVDSVSVSPDTLRLYTGGETFSLTAKIYPISIPARYSWRSALSTIASVDTTGKVSPVTPGRTYVSATSLVDATRRDSALVIVKKDSPKIQIGGDTTISIGQTLTYLPAITQEYGLTTMIRWDLDGDGAWDDSSANPKTVSYRYAEAKEYATRFSARDSEGNDTTVTRKVRSVNGPVILISLPADGSYTNQSPVTVAWSVDGAPQTASENLKAGANLITRSAKNSAGETFSASITVYYDTIPPTRPMVKGPTGPISSLRPAWTWEPAGGGNGSFRLRLDNENLAVGATMVSDTAFTPGTNLVGGPHTLYVQERDLAGNWSPSGSFTIRIDTTPPAPPVVTALPASPTNNRRPTWSWTGAATEGTSAYRYKLDNNDFRTGATLVSTATFTPATGAELLEGPHTLHVQHQDSAGNWSAPGSATVTVDITAPTREITTTNTLTGTADFTLAGKVSDAGSGVAKVTVSSAQAIIAAGDAVIAADGTWTKSGITLSAGANTLDAIATDKAGNVATKVSLTVTLDNAGPVLTITPAATPTTTPSLSISGTVSDAGSGVEKVTVSSAQATVAAGDAIIAGTGTGWSKNGITLSEGANTITVTATDKAGKTTTASIVVTLDTTPSGNPGSGSVTSPTSSRTPTFTWISGGGIGTYRVRMDVDNFTTGYTEVKVASYTPPASATLSDGSHKLYVRETDANGNWSGSLAIDVVVDATKPTLAVTSGAGTIATITTTLIFTTIDGGTGVTATPTCKLGTKTFIVTKSGSSWSCAVTGLASGANSVILDAVDGVGNTGSATASINVSVPVPKVTIKSPANYFVTNNTTPKITYQVDSDPDQIYISPALSDGMHEITVSSLPNDVGVSGTAKITVYVRSNVIFVGPIAKGAGDGSSWDDVTAGLYANMTKVANIGKEIWVDAGTYSTASTKWEMVNDLKIYGGFNGSSRPNSNALSNRPSKSKVTGTWFTVSDNGNVIVDGFSFSGTRMDLGTTAGKKITIANSEIVDQTGDYAMGTGGDGEILFDKVIITKNRNANGTLLLGGKGSKTTFTGGEITENTVVNEWGKIVEIQAGAVVFNGGLQVSGNVVNTGASYPQVSVADQEMSPSLDVVSGVTLPLNQIYVYQFEGVILGCLRYHGTVYGVCSNF